MVSQPMTYHNVVTALLFILHSFFLISIFSFCFSNYYVKQVMWLINYDDDTRRKGV